MRKKYRIFTIVLCISLVGSSFFSVANGFAKEISEQLTPLFSKKPFESDRIDANGRIYQPEQVVLKTEVDSTEGEEPVYQGSRDSLVDPSEQKDLISFSQEEMERYLLEGYSIADLYEADALANEIFVEPDELLKMKKEAGSWEDIRSKGVEQQTAKVVDSLKAAFPAEYMELQKYELTPEEEILLLAAYDRNRSTSIDQLAENYKNSPELFTAERTNALFDVRSEQAIENKQQATEPEELSDREMEKLKELASKRNLSLDVLVEKYQSSKRGE